MSAKKTCVIWLRKDLRLSDHPGFAMAIALGYHLIPIYIHDARDSVWSEGAASSWWLHHALTDLNQQLMNYGGEIHVCLCKGTIIETLESVIQEYEADVIFWGRRYEPEIIDRDSKIKTRLIEQGIQVKSFNTHLLFEPHTVQNKSGSHFKVFTPYWKHCKEIQVNPLIVNDFHQATFRILSRHSQDIESLNLLPRIKWDQEFYQAWNPTRSGAEKRLTEMVSGKAIEYIKSRDTPSIDGTSKLSPWLQWGQLSAREIYHAFGADCDDQVHLGYLRQIFWREFSYHLLFHAPHSTDKPLRSEYELFQWDSNSKYLEDWMRGQTGYPIVDAGMRQLWQTGWMHNRVRMIVSSFLVKHLLQDWRDGARHFWDTLVDADLANNTMGWQWIAGSGADASPYFRIFNPITQGEKFDEKGRYVREFCPELKKLPDKYLHQPWEAPELELAVAGVTLGKDYPHPIISHKDGRQRALDAFANFKKAKEELS